MKPRISQSKSKYKNTKITADGITFDSKKEYEFWLVLKQRERSGEIENLRRQERYLLVPSQEKERPIHYIADFVYYHRGLDKEIVVDVKSAYTRKLPVYIIKRKLMLWVHGIKVVEI